MRRNSSLELFAAALEPQRKKPIREMMPRDQAFHKRIGDNYRAMKTRVGPRYWKSGVHKGRLRSAGRELPFDVEEYYDWALEKLGGTTGGTVKCRYCPRVLTAMDFQTDHVTPLKQGGGVGLDNLDPCCGDCNRYKGGLTEQGFLALRAALRWLAGERVENAERGIIVPGCMTLIDSAEIERRLKGGVVYHKTQRGKTQEPKT